MVQVQRPKRKPSENMFFHHTCRLANPIGVDLRGSGGLKNQLVGMFWKSINSFDELKNALGAKGAIVI